MKFISGYGYQQSPRRAPNLLYVDFRDVYDPDVLLRPNYCRGILFYESNWFQGFWRLTMKSTFTEAAAILSMKHTPAGHFGFSGGKKILWIPTNSRIFWKKQRTTGDSMKICLFIVKTMIVLSITSKEMNKGLLQKWTIKILDLVPFVAPVLIHRIDTDLNIYNWKTLSSTRCDIGFKLHNASE